ncbi:YihY/virulence factor BrkB family protein [Pelagibacterium sediminicola]|uniref:YihY/virulence factor BrkB family protein n=1 Tax=Pelagibacterium sediminicola TaxID=2248761 RepID=UPI000E31EDF7|nr:YihY/virulence factor BrkB family protein [Pelagibacterium sediminicola]
MAAEEFTAHKPVAIGWRGWKAIIGRTIRSMSDKDTSLRCAGVAFFGFLSIFPAIAIVVLMVGILGDHDVLRGELARLSAFMPEMSFSLILNQLDSVMSQPPSGLGIGLAMSIVVALWSGSRGVDALIHAASVAYHERTERKFVTSVLLSFAVTVLGALFMIIALGLIAAIPIITRLSPIPGTSEQLALLLRWPVLLALSVMAFALLYRFTVNRRAARLRWIWPGATLASVLWLIASLLFSLYVEYFGEFEATFGSIAATVVLLFWLYISALIFVLGATLNAEIELQTSIDTTIGPARPIGKRGAYVADNVADR